MNKRIEIVKIKHGIAELNNSRKSLRDEKGREKVMRWRVVLNFDKQKTKTMN